MNSIPMVSWSDSVRRSLGEAQCSFEGFRDAIDPFQRSFERTIADHPIKAVLLSLATGVFLGWLVKR